MHLTELVVSINKITSRWQSSETAAFFLEEKLGGNFTVLMALYLYNHSHHSHKVVSGLALSFSPSIIFYEEMLTARQKENLFVLYDLRQLERCCL